VCHSTLGLLQIGFGFRPGFILVPRIGVFTGPGNRDSRMAHL